MLRFHGTKIFGRGFPVKKTANDWIVALVEYIWRTTEPRTPLAEQHHMVGNFEGQRNVMRYHDAGSAEHLLQAIEQVGDDVTTNGIKPGRRFVVQNALWTLHDGPCQRDTLALATGQFTGKTINTCFDPQQGQDFLGGLAPLRRIHRRVLAKRKGDVLQYRHGIKQRSLLKQEPDATSNVYEAMLGELVDLLA